MKATPALEHIVRFAHQHRERRLDPREVASLERLIIDASACIHSAWEGEAVSRARTVVSGGRSAELRGRDAAFSWGVALRDLDYLDVYASRDICHPAENVAVALGLAQDARARGRAFLEAVAAAYEVQCRLADAVDLRGAGIHHTAAASLTVPVMANRLGLLADEHLLPAMAIALARGATLRAISRGKISQVKAFAFPLTARTALEATDLAAAGISGPERVLDEVLTLAGGDVDDVAEAFEDSRPETTRLTAVGLKTAPVQYALQGVVECGSRLAPAIADTSRVRTIRVSGAPRVTENTTDPDKRDPENRETADHSLFATLAIVLATGRCGASELLSAAWERPDVRRLASLIEVDARSGQDGTLSLDHPLWIRVTVELNGAEDLVETVQAPTGTPANPVSDDALASKFHECASGRLGETQRERILEHIRGLDDQADVTALPGVDSARASK